MISVTGFIMNTDDDFEKNRPINATQEKSNPKGSSADSENFDIASLTGEVFIEAKEGHRWANFTAAYEWSPDGTHFALKNSKYSATDNGSRKGNVEIGMQSAGNTGYVELTNDNAIQDGNWHNTNRNLAVSGNASWVKIWYAYTYDMGGSDPKLFGYTELNYTPPTPTVHPIRNVNSQDAFISGRYNVAANGKVYVRTSIHASHHLARSGSISGVWEVNVPISPNLRHMSFVTYMQVGTRVSRESPSSDVYVVSITHPVANSILVVGNTFRGFGAPGSKVKVVKADDHNFQLAPEATVGLNDSWQSTLNVGLTGDAVSVVAIYELSGFPRVVSAPVNYRLMPVLVITGPTAQQEMNFTVVGGNGITGATVDVKIDFGGPRVGGGTVGPSGAWTAAVQMPTAGSTSLVAIQTYQNVPSQPSAPRSFKIKPPKLVDIQVSYPRPGTVRFSGGGYNTATVDVHIRNNNTPQVWTVVSGDQWSVDWPDQIPGSYEFDLRQKVSDGPSDWIHSTWSDTVEATIPVPVPTLRALPGADRKPELSGTGHSWSNQPATTVEVRVSGPSVPSISPINVNGSNWNYTASDAWPPGAYQLEARQVFKGIPSTWTSPVSLIINTPSPTINVTENGLTPIFSGTCLNGAQVKLGFDGDQGTPHAATVTGTTWTFTRPTPFTPGAYTARVIQTVNDQPSNVLSRAFTVVVLKPVITAPIDEEVDHNPVIQGTGGIAGAVMQVFDYVSDTQLGGDTPVEGNEWSVPLEDLAFGSHSVYAIQKYGAFASEKSEPVSFKVILFPPVIDHPQPGEAMARVSLIDGHARKGSGHDTARVELWLDGADEPWATVRARALDGYWSYRTDLSVGDYVLRARQEFAGVASEFGPSQNITVVPAIPVIESPAMQQHVGATVTVSGFGYVGDWVEVAWSDAPDALLGSVQVQANRTWSLQLQIARPAGENHWVVRQECDGYRSAWSEAHPVRVLSQAPTFTAPEAGHWFADAPLFEGTGDTGKTVELSHWFDSQRIVARDSPIADGGWTATPASPWVAGPHWVKARQLGQDESDWSDGPRVQVAGPKDAPLVSR